MGGGITPLPIIYYVLLHKDYIQMSLFLGIPNGSPKTLDVHIFLKSSLFRKCKAIFCSLENIFPMVYSMLQLDFIWPLLLKDLWLGIKFPIWFPPFFYHNSCKLNLNEQCKGIFKHLHIKTFLIVFWGPNLVLVFLSN